MSRFIAFFILVYSLSSNAQSPSSLNSPKVNCIKIKDLNLMRSCLARFQKVNLKKIKTNVRFQNAVKKRNLLHETNKNNSPKW